ncbi:MAG TPA: sulfotransferase [Rhizomicrobium sp.]|nr:sulfotransferase [Rhizomicrobium sp.]
MPMVTFQRGPSDPRAIRFQTLAGGVDAALKAGDMARAIAGAEAAIAEGFAHPAFYNLLAARDMQKGLYREALAQLRSGLRLAPRDANLLNMQGVAHNNLAEYREAIRALDAAILAAPSLAPAHYNRGVAHERLGEMNRARADFERAVQLQPNHLEARSRLAYSEAVRGQLAAARRHAESALRLAPRDQLSHIALAMAENADRRYDAAIARLTALLPDLGPDQINRALALGLLGDAQDGAGDAARAFDAYRQSKDLLHRLYAPAHGAANVLGQAAMLRDYFAAAPAERWTADGSAPADPNAAGHVFLVGFPRSGTTLLEQTLAGHPAVVTSEEKDLLADTARELAASPAALDRLAALKPPQAARQRDLYWKRAREAGLKAKDKVFVDKLPLNTLLLPLVAKLFPHAKVLFALRDPRDVVFSCFRRAFDMSDQMYQLVTLEGAARYYDAVMGAGEIYRAKLGLAWRDVRHEDFVRDYEAQARDLCGWLGLTWNDEMTKVAERLRKRAVNTPSTMQIVRGVTTEGFAAWKRYEAQMQGVMPLLAPWVERFGYED